MSVPDVAGVVAGWRRWALDCSEGRPHLVSPLRGTRWEPGEALPASCPHGHSPPTDGCLCGVHAARHPVLAGQAGVGEVIGAVVLWGDVVEGQHGWRASHAYPRVLVVDPTVPGDVLDQLAEDYRVEVHRSTFGLDIIRAIPTEEQIRTHRTVGPRSADRLVAARRRHQAAADRLLAVAASTTASCAADVETLLDASRAFFDDLRTASLRRIPRDLARPLLRLCVPLDLWLGLSRVGVSAQHAGEAWVALPAVATLAAIPLVLAQFGRGLREIREVLAQRFHSSVLGKLQRAVAVPVLALTLLQGFATIGPLFGQVSVARVAPAFLELPLVLLLLSLVGWSQCFAPLRPGRLAPVRPFAVVGRRHGPRLRVRSTAVPGSGVR